MNVRPNMFVATATFASRPNCNITGTVRRELLPVTTPTAEVMKKRTRRKMYAEIDIPITEMFIQTNSCDEDD